MNIKQISIPARKRDLAMYFFPSKDYTCALRKFNRWIHDDRDLRDALIAAHCTPWRKFYNKKQVDILIYYLGA